MQKLTIIIPTIGRDTLDRAVQSVKDQTIPTDYVVFEDKYKDGAGPTRNLAMATISGDWVGFCDDDDWLDPHYHEWLDKEKYGYDVVIFKMKNSPVGAIPESCEVDRLEYNKVGMSFAMRTTLAQDLQFKNMIGEDFDILMRAKQLGVSMKIVDKVAYIMGDLKE